MLNRDILPPGYIALEQVHAGTPIEIDVATLTESATPARANGGGGTATMARTVWTPAAAPLLLPAVFPPRFTVEIHNPEGGRTLVGAIELVSPGNKDRAESSPFVRCQVCDLLEPGRWLDRRGRGHEARATCTMNSLSYSAWKQLTKCPRSRDCTPWHIVRCVSPARGGSRHGPILWPLAKRCRPCLFHSTSTAACRWIWRRPIPRLVSGDGCMKS